MSRSRREPRKRGSRQESQEGRGRRCNKGGKGGKGDWKKSQWEPQKACDLCGSKHGKNLCWHDPANTDTPSHIKKLEGAELAALKARNKARFASK